MEKHEILIELKDILDIAKQGQYTFGKIQMFEAIEEDVTKLLIHFGVEENNADKM